MRGEQPTLTVSAIVRHVPFCSGETMQALPDPADPNQAVIQNVPFFVDSLNFGDLVRLGPADEMGIRPVEEIVTPSGCVHFTVLTGELPQADLVAYLSDLFHPYAVRIESGESLLAVSVHPDLEPEEVVYCVFDWFEDLEPPPAEDAFGVSPLFESEVGPLGYPPTFP
ncbi:MAG TPA: DUF4265 domain-containing protein [Solirubrobacterales bacterium]|jgi:hypothetical protein